MKGSLPQDGMSETGIVLHGIASPLTLEEVGSQAFSDLSILTTRTDEELRVLWWKGEAMEFAAFRVRGAVAAELRRRYGYYGGRWTQRGASLLNTSERRVHEAARVWDAFHARDEYLERLGAVLARACAESAKPDEAIKHALCEKKRGRKVHAIAREIRRLFSKRAGFQEQFHYGPPLDFRYLRHEPIDEQGVVFLFGVLADGLGFLVEAVRQRFPDCRAKRKVGGKYEDVTIEFEFRSSDFIKHHHDEKRPGCDLIVCWEHDWSDCPMEVVELKMEVQRLATGRRGDTQQDLH